MVERTYPSSTGHTDDANNGVGNLMNGLSYKVCIGYEFCSRSVFLAKYLSKERFDTHTHESGALSAIKGRNNSAVLWKVRIKSIYI